MRKEKHVLAVVPARGGSKGIKLKNLLKLDNKTLIEHVGDVVRECDFIDKTVVSTDHEKIKAEALNAGLDAPFMRPEVLSGDCVGDIDVLKHALLSAEKFYGMTFDIILMLQPTSPFRTYENIKECVDTLIHDETDSCITVSPTHYKMHPLKQLCVKSGMLSYYDPSGEAVISRHLVDPVYYGNGVCYALTRTCILEKGRMMTDNTKAVIVNDFTVDIDCLDDVRLAEYHLAVLKGEGKPFSADFS